MVMLSGPLKKGDNVVMGQVISDVVSMCVNVFRGQVKPIHGFYIDQVSE